MKKYKTLSSLTFGILASSFILSPSISEPLAFDFMDQYQSAYVESNPYADSSNSTNNQTGGYASSTFTGPSNDNYSSQQSQSTTSDNTVVLAPLPDTLPDMSGGYSEPTPEVSAPATTTPAPTVTTPSTNTTTTTQNSNASSSTNNSNSSSSSNVSNNTSNSSNASNNTTSTPAVSATVEESVAKGTINLIVSVNPFPTDFDYKDFEIILVDKENPLKTTSITLSWDDKYMKLVEMDVGDYTVSIDSYYTGVQHPNFEIDTSVSFTIEEGKTLGAPVAYTTNEVAPQSENQSIITEKTQGIAIFSYEPMGEGEIITIHISNGQDTYPYTLTPTNNYTQNIIGIEGVYTIEAVSADIDGIFFADLESFTLGNDNEVDISIKTTLNIVSDEDILAPEEVVEKEETNISPLVVFLAVFASLTTVLGGGFLYKQYKDPRNAFFRKQ